MNPTAELILHIGHYKTGTTALQVSCTAHDAALAQQGLVYSPFPLHLHKHSALAFCLLQEAGVKTLMHGFNTTTSARDLWERVFKLARGMKSGQSLLVSSEEFMRLGEHVGAHQNLQAIFAEAPDIRVRVIAYLRSPQSHLLSWYNQLVKMGATDSNFDATVCGEIESIHWDYARALAPWIKTFGPDRVIVRHYHEGLRDGGALFSDFLEALGYRVPPGFHAPHRDPNPRLDDRILGLKRAYMRAELPKGLINSAIARATDNLAIEDGTGQLPETPDFVTIREAARAGIESLVTLPHASLDAAQLCANLPRPLSAEARAMSDLVALLAGELGQMRAVQRNMNTRLTALENALASYSKTATNADEGGQA